MGNKTSVFDLSGADLTGINLEGASLQGVNLTGANLTGAQLKDAYISGCQLDKTVLTRTNFSDAHISSSSFYRAQFENVNLSNTTFCSSDFQFCSFSKTSLADVSLGNSNFFGVRGFHQSELKSWGWRIMVDGMPVPFDKERRYLGDILVRTSQHFACKFYQIFVGFLPGAWRLFSAFWLCLLILGLHSTSTTTVLPLLSNSIKFGCSLAFMHMLFAIGTTVSDEVTGLSAFERKHIYLIECIETNLSLFILPSAIFFAIECRNLFPSNSLVAIINSVFLLGTLLYFTLALILPKQITFAKLKSVLFLRLFK